VLVRAQTHVGIGNLYWHAGMELLEFSWTCVYSTRLSHSWVVVGPSRKWVLGGSLTDMGFAPPSRKSIWGLSRKSVLGPSRKCVLGPMGNRPSVAAPALLAAPVLAEAVFSTLLGRGGFKAGRGRPWIRLVLPRTAPTGVAHPRCPGVRPVRPSGPWFGVWALLAPFSQPGFGTLETFQYLIAAT
jgi:hypothetical protein